MFILGYFPILRKPLLMEFSVSQCKEWSGDKRNFGMAQDSEKAHHSSVLLHHSSVLLAFTAAGRKITLEASWKAQK